jgi:hypothetical protein
LIGHREATGSISLISDESHGAFSSIWTFYTIENAYCNRKCII